MFNSGLRAVTGRWSKLPFSSIWKMFHRPVTRGLLLVDVLLILLHVFVGILSVTDVLAGSPSALRIDMDWGVGETTNYVKWLCIICISLILYNRYRESVFLGTTFLSTIALLDDSMQWHEYLGLEVAPALFPDWPKGVGELFFMAIQGFLMLLVFAYTWKRSSSYGRCLVIPLLLLLGGAIFCGVVIDFLHSQTPGGARLEDLMAILEDGGEMIFISLMVGYAAGLLIVQRPPEIRYS